MKIKFNRFLIFPMLVLILTTFLIGCGDDSTSSNSQSGKPDIQFKPGAVYTFRNDSITQGGAYKSTDWITKDSTMASTTYGGKSCFSVNSVTKNGLGIVIRQNTDYYSYTQSEGIFYQWGARNVIDPGQAATWDEIADFTKSLGTEVSLYTITNLFNQASLSANVYSKVVVDTTAPLLSTVKCYRISVRAEVFASTVSLGNVYIDYYIGYNSTSGNPSGRVGTHIYPVNIGVPGVYTLQYDGADQRLTIYSLP